MLRTGSARLEAFIGLAVERVGRELSGLLEEWSVNRGEPGSLPPGEAGSLPGAAGSPPPGIVG